jgi:hypothetical protein
MSIQQALASVPYYVFSLKNYQEPIELSHDFGHLGIKTYIYGFTHSYAPGHPYDIIRYGQSNDNEWRRGTFGSRAYREAGNINGWARPLTGPNGEEMRFDYLPRYQSNTGRIVHKDDVAIQIWDFTNFNFPSMSQVQLYLEKVEHYQMAQYENIHKHIPHGNKSNEAHAANKTFVYDDLFENLFVKS